MSHQTHIERLARRESAARARVRSEPVINDEDGTVPPVAAARSADGAGSAWAVGGIVAGRFVLQQYLGRGRYGPIYKALDRSLSEALIGVEHHVALQELHPRIAAQPILLERLEQQPLQPQSWSHPNLVKLLDFGRDGAKYFLSTELLEGASLRLVMDDSAAEPLTYREVLGVLRAVGDVLNYAHAKGIVHGDVRPENVFVTNGYAIKLLDLLPSSEPRPVAFFVEDADSGGQPHPSDDVYGLACLAYELLTGRHPYNGNSPIEALRAGLAPHPVPDYPPLRWQALSRGLALRRERRTASVPELLAGLGVMGTETLHPPAVEDAQPQPVAQRVPPPQAALWPEITDPLAEKPRGARAAAAAAAALAPPARTQSDWSDEPLFARAVLDEEVPAWALRQARPRRSSAVRMVLGVVLLVGLAAPAMLVYRDHAQLRIQAADLIETGVAFVAGEMAQWRARSAAPNPSSVGTAVVPSAVEDSSPVPSAQAPGAQAPTAPVAGVAAGSADDEAAQAITPEAAARNSSEAADTRPAAPPAPVAPPSPSVTAATPVAASRFEFAERTVTVSEREASARIVIRRTGALDTEASVVWWTADRTAFADDDYAVLGARIETFAAGEESRSVYVPLVADSIAEGRESFVVNLRAERPGSAAPAQLEVVVIDDDAPTSWARPRRD